MKYLIIDALLGGTGIRNKYDGAYVDPQTLMLSNNITNQLNSWLTRYGDEHFNGFNDDLNIDKLDQEGIQLALAIKEELVNAKLAYFSAARLLMSTI
ncbi:hypothetical protein DYBT9623_00871 [Dyadobacter sp. CECT 9623]|uniref:Uncharacterized protein n=1 Tax=Dyadobacter linearis TaxID=2823330 RepID=A0ABN7R8S2_9BACT|nr:hypothetical protein [Dyadobacter sp. CECT 9623]CAG5068142.1 hypothetical protein DYBT9623_00871 [Dyadobacter sp. CECT 9623]